MPNLVSKVVMKPVTVTFNLSSQPAEVTKPQGGLPIPTFTLPITPQLATSTSITSSVAPSPAVSLSSKSHVNSLSWSRKKKYILEAYLLSREGVHVCKLCEKSYKVSFYLESQYLSAFNPFYSYKP